ncbi:MAG: cupin domain-containing protein, partial [Chloroflexi bacterium]|nr:cupin domain-containing protein [Chloroflexota bacterium]
PTQRDTWGRLGVLAARVLPGVAGLVVLLGILRGTVFGPIDSLAIIREAIGVGDRIPLHTHDVDEAITILDGVADTRLGEEQRRVGPDAVVFIPAGTPHATANAGTSSLEIQAVFPTTTIEIAMLERNPAPGTEADAPRRSRYDLRTGDFEPIE